MRIGDGQASGLVTSGPAQAGLTVGLTVVTSAAAHVEGGGLLPDGRGLPLLVVGALLWWRVCVRLVQTRTGLLVALALGQLGGHACYGMDTPMPGMAMPGGDGAPIAMLDALGTCPPDPGAMPDMTGAHPVAAMWLCHVAAVLVCAALALALRLPATLQTWLARILPSTPGAWLGPPRRVPPWPRRRWLPRWAPASPPPRRGPPLRA